MLCVVLVVAVATVVIQLAGDRPAADRPIRVASGSWAPYVDPELPGGGPVAQLVTEALNRAGYAPEVDHTSWHLAEDRVASGTSTAVFPMVASKERREEFLLSDPLLEFRYVLFHDTRRPLPPVTRPEDLAELEVGGIAGYDYWDELHAAVGELELFDSSLEGFRALAAGEVDVLAEGLLPGRAVLADPDFAADADDFDALPGDDPWLSSTEGLHLMVPRTPAARQLLSAFDDALASLRDTDSHAQLLAGLETDGAEVVGLEPVGGASLVQLREHDGTPSFLALRGTRAEVLAWPDALSSDGAANRPGKVLVQVKLTNGPGQGRVVWVEAGALVLEPGP